MPAVARVNEDVGDDGQKIVEGALDIFVDDGLPMALQGSTTSSGAVVIAGSLTVFAEGRQVARQGDKFDNGTVIPTGSLTIDIGDVAPDNVSFIPNDPYTPEYVRPLLQRAGSNAPNDEPDSVRRTYDFVEKPAKTNNPGAAADTTPAKESTGKPVDCGDFASPIDYNENLTSTYTIASFSRKAYFAHNIRAQSGLSEAQIICNLKALAENIVEPLRAQYPGFQINSGFRSGEGQSQHGRGQAVDVQWIGRPNRSMTDMAFWVRDNLPFDQFIFEHGNGGIWFHLSYNRNSTKQRGSILTYYPFVPRGTPEYKPGITNHYG
jgi:uncharacterized Zn-binding protein involved in type VI secretion